MTSQNAARFTPLAVLAALIVSPAEAHLIGASGAGLAQGFTHPFTGLDHLLAMIAVGCWAAQIGGRAVFVLPLVFPAMMCLGALLGGSGLPLPAVETGIAVSVVVLGVMVALGVRLPLPVSAAIVGLFAVLHGHSHGTELPLTADPVLYAAGFLAATLVLHGIGILVGLALNRAPGSLLTRVTGSGIAGVGLLIVAELG